MSVPETDEVKYKVAEILSVAQVDAYLDPNNIGDKRIIVLEDNFEDPYEPEEEYWSRIVIMDQIGMFRVRDHEDRNIPHHIYIRCDIMKPRDSTVDFKVGAFLQRLHTLIFNLLNTRTFDLERAEMVMPMFRIERPVSVHKSERGFHYNGSTYKTVLGSYEE